MSVLTEAKLYRDAADVVRYHTKRTLRQQTVGQHTFGILMLLRQVLPMTGIPEDRWATVYTAALHHDLPELFTGDVPAPIKRVHPGLGPMMDSIEQDLHPLYYDACLTPAEEALLKWADRMDLVLWCLEEVRLGNSFMRATVARGLGWILAARMPAGVDTLTSEAVADARSVGIEPASGAELEMKA